MSQESQILSVKGLAIGYKGKVLHSNMNFDLRKGELIALIGKNGVGKSTLFKTIQGAIPLIEGSVSLMQKNIDTYSTNEKSRLISVVLTQRPILYGMTVLEIIKMGRHPYSKIFGSLSLKDEEIVNQSIKNLGIEKLRDKFLYEISDGEYQKMMLARALAQDTPLILMDEPTAFLDYPSKLELISKLQTLCKDLGKTILFSTHEIPLIENKIDGIIGMTKDIVKTYISKEGNSQIWSEEILGVKIN